MTPSELSQQIEALLTTQLGKFANGQPAIWVGDNYPTGTPKGLAVFISYVPEIISTKLSSANRKTCVEHYIVTLVQFDRSKSTLEALRIIQKNFLISSIDTTTANERDYEQTVIRIRNYLFI